MREGTDALSPLERVSRCRVRPSRSPWAPGATEEPRVGPHSALACPHGACPARGVSWEDWKWSKQRAHLLRVLQPRTLHAGPAARNLGDKSPVLCCGPARPHQPSEAHTWEMGNWLQEVAVKVGRQSALGRGWRGANRRGYGSQALGNLMSQTEMNEDYSGIETPGMQSRRPVNSRRVGTDV